MKTRWMVTVWRLRKNIQTTNSQMSGYKKKQEVIMDTYVTEISGVWYAYAARDYTVFSIGRDCPISGRLCARYTEDGIKYVASASPSKRAAIAKAKRHGEYGGTVDV